MYRNYTDEDIIKYAAEVVSMAGLLRKLGLKPVGASYKNMKRMLQRLKVNCDHWTGQSWNKNQRVKDWQDYTRSAHLKKNLLKERGHKCEKCLNSEWMGSPIAIEIHHIDGESTNNHIHNLQLLCPNCHALTDNWRGRAAKKEVIVSQETPDYIPTLNKIVKTRAPKIKKLRLSAPPKAKSNWYPTNQELFDAVWQESVLSLSKKYGITSNAIKNRCVRRKIPVPPPGYWARKQHGQHEECRLIYKAAKEKFQQALSDAD